MRVNEHDGQTFLWKVEFVLEYRGQLPGVLPLGDSPLLSVTDMERVEAPEVYQNDDITPEVSKHFGDDSKQRKYFIF